MKVTFLYEEKICTKNAGNNWENYERIWKIYQRNSTNGATIKLH